MAPPGTGCGSGLLGGADGRGDPFCGQKTPLPGCAGPLSGCVSWMHHGTSLSLSPSLRSGVSGFRVGTERHSFLPPFTSIYRVTATGQGIIPEPKGVKVLALGAGGTPVCVCGGGTGISTVMENKLKGAGRRGWGLYWQSWKASGRRWHLSERHMGSRGNHPLAGLSHHIRPHPGHCCHHVPSRRQC